MPNPTRSIKTVVKITTSGERFIEKSLVLGTLVFDSGVFILRSLLSLRNAADPLQVEDAQKYKELITKIKTQSPASKIYRRLPPAPVSPRSTESAPPPAMSKDKQPASSTSGYSMPAGA